MPISQAKAASVSKSAGAESGPAEQVPAVVRSLAVLDLLSRQTGPISLARLTSELELPKSSIRAICNTLASCGYVRRHADGSYRLSPKIVSLAETFLAGTDVTREFNSIWSDSKSDPEETVLLSVLSGHEAVYLAVRNSVRPLGLAFRVGLKFPAWVSASGKAMLAYLPEQEARRIAGDGLKSPKGLGSPKALERFIEELALTRQRGYSIDDQGIREGVYALGAPVFDAAGAVVAAVSVCVSKLALEDHTAARHRDLTLGVARELTERLGGSVAPTGN
ncbi:IclR family transcriptional regulator [Xylophilus sp. GOD-11R]|uniref:IclR family transcriptional regulator n=1 Tax=Xylophilus sp. GOD-11R TaxID=3089814 RepID=UPI00298C1D96|nr:IclR family transcriptional regulator [Xylophilus sp. GOD-11R]WPB59233.1 IclR family transcriptional regulator [Xylophilus sp. GOD-11R]